MPVKRGPVGTVKSKSILQFFEGLTPETLDDLELISALKCPKQLRSMIDGARAEGKYDTTVYLIAALIVRHLKDVRVP